MLWGSFDVLCAGLVLSTSNETKEDEGEEHPDKWTLSRCSIYLTATSSNCPLAARCVCGVFVAVAFPADDTTIKDFSFFTATLWIFTCGVWILTTCVGWVLTACICGIFITCVVAFCVPWLLFRDLFLIDTLGFSVNNMADPFGALDIETGVVLANAIDTLASCWTGHFATRCTFAFTVVTDFTTVTGDILTRSRGCGVCCTFSIDTTLCTLTGDVETGVDTGSFTTELIGRTIDASTWVFLTFCVDTFFAVGATFCVTVVFDADAFFTLLVSSTAGEEAEVDTFTAGAAGA